MKKNRGFCRQLKGELKAMQQELDLIRAEKQALQWRLERTCMAYNSLKGRIVKYDMSHIVSQLEYSMEVGSERLMTDMKRRLISSLVENEAFLDTIQLEKDEDFLGCGTRYCLSLNIVKPDESRL